MRKKNLIGQQFARLIVIEEVESLNKKDKRPSWKCRCECGNEIIVRTGFHLTSGNTKSCGCLRSEKSAENLSKTSLANKKYEPRISSAMIIYRGRYNDGDLSFDNFYILSQMNCLYCNTTLSNKKNTIYPGVTQYYIDNCEFTYNGLDRVDNNLPHNLNNCVPCCFECNSSKNSMSLNNFFTMINNIIKFKGTSFPNYQELYLTNKEDLLQFKKIKSAICKKYKDIDFELEMLFFIISLNCFYCGAYRLNKTKAKNGDIIPCNGLDRIDQTKPHTLDNILPCCKFCNWSKSERSFSQFISWATRVYENSNEAKILQFLKDSSSNPPKTSLY